MSPENQSAFESWARSSGYVMQPANSMDRWRTYSDEMTERAFRQYAERLAHGGMPLFDMEMPATLKAK